MKHRIVNITEFRAKCLALFGDIRENGDTITITRRGRPLATVGPAQMPAWKSPEGSWVGKVKITGDLLEDTSELWEVLRPSHSRG